jgi:hypothetical protein
MNFSHSSEIWDDYPELVPGVLGADGIGAGASVLARLAKYQAISPRQTPCLP